MEVVSFPKLLNLEKVTFEKWTGPEEGTMHHNHHQFIVSLAEVIHRDEFLNYLAYGFRICNILSKLPRVSECLQRKSTCSCCRACGASLVCPSSFRQLHAPRCLP